MMNIDKTDRTIVPSKTDLEKSNIPKELKTLKFWGLWTWFWNKQWTKVPIDKYGNHIDVKTFHYSFKEAYKIFKKNKTASGLGFFFSPESDVFGVDFDNCISPSGKVDKTVKQQLKTLDTYYEKSPSGTGFHALSFGQKKLNGVDKKYVYGGLRYFTFTGQGGKGKIRDASKEANELFLKEKKIDQIVIGTKESDISLKDLKGIVSNIQPNLPEPDWFIVCKAIHFKTLGSEAGYKLFIEWSRGDYCEEEFHYKEYNEEDCQAKWRRCKIKKNSVGLPQLRNIESLYPVSTKKDVKKLFEQSLEQLSYNAHSLNIDCIPKNMHLAALEVARFNKVSVDPVITTMLMVFSAAINKKVRIIERDGLDHNCSMGCIIGMPSGGRKSAIDRPLLFPFKVYEKELMREWEATQAKAKAEVKVLKKKYVGIENDQEMDEETKIEMMANIEHKINKLSQSRPKLIESDATEEKLSDSLMKNNETMFIHSDDARNTIKNITGRYDNSSENIYITGLTGDTYRRSRVKDDIEIVLYSPCINMCLKVQLDLLRELVTKTSMRESGLLARMFIKVLDDNVADQFRIEHKERDLNYKDLDAYDQALKRILHFEGKVIVCLSKQAKKRWVEFSNEYADMLDGTWNRHKDVSNKTISLSVKMATVLTIMKNPGILEMCKSEFGISCFEIEEEEYLKAKEIVLVLMRQTLDVLDKLEKNDIIKGAMNLLEKLQKDVTERAVEDWAMSDIKIKYSKASRDFVETWVSCLLDAGILVVDGNRYSMAN